MRTPALFAQAVALVCLAAPVGSGCTRQQRVAAETSLAEHLISDREEAAIGQQVQQQMRKQGMRLLDDPVVNEYVGGVADRVLGAIPDQRTARTIDVRVIDAPQVVNAMAIPGRTIYVFSGLLLFADDEAEVAAVIAHEAGHIVRRHVARQLLYLYGYKALAGLALGGDPSQLEQLAATLLGQGFLAVHSRAEEHEADRVGLGFLTRSGYDPRGMPRFFGKLLARKGHTPALLVWLSSHPTTESRIAEVREIIRRRGVVGGYQGAPDQAAIKERLRARMGRQPSSR